MATTFVEYTGDGQASKQFTFPSYQESDVKVRVDGVLKTTSTHYNITNYTTTGGGNVVFTSGNIPSSPANIRIYRDTNVDTAKATFTAGSSVKAADLNNNTTQLLYRAQEEQIPNLIHSYDIDDGAITGAKIGEKQVDTVNLADNSVGSLALAPGIVSTAKFVDGAVTTAKLAADSVTNAKIADDSIDSEHYVDGSIDTAHIANDAITNAKIADDAVDTEHLADNSVGTLAIGPGTITTAKIVDGNITHAKIQDNAVITAKIADGNVTSVKIADDSVTAAKITAGAVTESRLGVDSVTNAKIANNAVASNELADNAVTSAKIASNAVTTDKIADGELTTLAGMQSGTASKLADSTALTADIADLNQIDGMAKQTTITDDDTKFPTSGAVVDYVAAQLEPFGGFEAIANESSFPNTQPVSGVAISIADAGGMSVSNTGTASGATVGGTTVNISGIPSNFHSSTVAAGIRFIVTSTGSGQNYTYHKATLKEDDLINLSGDINDFSERYRVGSSNPTSSLDSGDLFFNTGTGKLLVYNGTNSAWEEAQSVGNFFINTISSSSATGGGSATPNGTAYRFTLSNAGTNAEQHIVSVDGVIQKPNSGSSQPSEGFAVSGSDIIFGSAPVSGASIFVITIGSTVNIGTPSNNTVTSAILQNGSVTTAKITDANVTTAKIANGAVTTAKIAAGAITNSQVAANAIGPGTIVSNAVTTAKIADEAVTLAKLEHGTSSNNGKFLRANNGADPTFETVNTDLVSDTSPQLGGDLDTNSRSINFGDSSGGGVNRAQFGASNDLKMFHSTSGNSMITNSTGELLIESNGNIVFEKVGGTEVFLKAIPDGAVELYHNNSKKFETLSSGIKITGLNATGSSVLGDFRFKDQDDNLDVHYDAENNKIQFLDDKLATFGAGDDLQIYHNGTNSFIQNQTGYLRITGFSGQVYIQSNDDVRITGHTADENMAVFHKNGAVELYYDNSKKFETHGSGATITGRLDMSDNNCQLSQGSTSRLRITSGYGYVNIGSANSGYAHFETDRNKFYFNKQVEWDGHIMPYSSNTYDLGTSSTRWRNIYTNDLHLSNEGHSNDVDGSWGDWTIQEGESDLFLKNNRSGKKYKFNLTEVS